MNKTIENIITRRSVKKYLDKQVPMELVEEVVKAGTYAPSGMNCQAGKIIAVTNKEMRDRLSRINGDILNNYSGYRGGGIYLSGNGTFTFTGGTISGNEAEYHGGGVWSNGTFTSCRLYSMYGRINFWNSWFLKSFKR